MNPVKKTFQYGRSTVTLETGRIARQATGAVMVTMDDTVVLCTVVAKKDVNPGQPFFPLSVHYQEKTYAVGKIPGGFFKREGRPTEKETLTSRLIDRPIRPLFPKGFMNEVQVIGYLLSTDLINEPDILMVNGASAALLISDIPWNGPVGCVRVAEIDGEFIVNPNNEQIFDSTLDLIYVGNEKEMLMIEGSADQMPEERFIEALAFAHDAIQDIIVAQRQLAELCGKEKKDFELVQAPDKVMDICRGIVGDRLNDAIFAPSKQEREEVVNVIKDEAAAAASSRAFSAVRASELDSVTSEASASSSISTFRGPRPRSESPMALRMICPRSSWDSGLSAKTRLRESRGDTTSNEGFSVVAPIRTTVPSSTCGRMTSCWALLNRWISSTNRMVRRSPRRRPSSAAAITARISLMPASTALKATNRDFVTAAITRASVVFPVPGGPQRMIDCRVSRSMA